MTEGDRGRAEAVLAQVLRGLRVAGMHWYGHPVLVFDRLNPGVSSEAYLRIDGPWSCSETGRPATVSADDLSRDGALERLASFALRRRETVVSEVALGDTVADLHITFATGASLGVAGGDPQFESWELEAGETTVVALPGGGIASF